MSDDVDDVGVGDADGHLAQLSARTAGLRPSRGFEDRVLLAIAGTAAASVPTWDQSVLRFGKTMLVVAALSAVAATIVGARTFSDETEASATAYGMEELDW